MRPKIEYVWGDRWNGRTDADGAVYMMVQKLPGPPGGESFVSWVLALTLSFAVVVVFCEGGKG